MRLPTVRESVFVRVDEVQSLTDRTQPLPFTYGKRVQRDVASAPTVVCQRTTSSASRRRSTLDRSAVTAHERDGLLTLHGARQHVSGRHTTDSQCRTSQPHDGKRVQRDVASAPTASERRALHQHAAPVRRSIDLP